MINCILLSGSILQNFIDLLINLITNNGYITVFISMTLESTLIPIPSEVVMPFAGYLVFIGKLNFVAVALVGCAANLLGSTICYFIGLYAGRALVLKYGKYVLLEERHLSLAERFFAKYGQSTIFFGRLLPLIRTVISLPAGFGKMNFPRFLIFTFLGSLPWNFALTYAGYALGTNWETILGFTRYADIVVIVLVVLLIVWFFVIRFRTNLKKVK